jgi:hypothetical protein
MLEAKLIKTQEKHRKSVLCLQDLTVRSSLAEEVERQTEVLAKTKAE